VVEVTIKETARRYMYIHTIVPFEVRVLKIIKFINLSVHFVLSRVLKYIHSLKITNVFTVKTSASHNKLTENMQPMGETIFNFIWVKSQRA
jgi:hypothetical protein